MVNTRSGRKKSGVEGGRENRQWGNVKEREGLRETHSMASTLYIHGGMSCRDRTVRLDNGAHLRLEMADSTVVTEQLSRLEWRYRRPRCQYQAHCSIHSTTPLKA